MDRDRAALYSAELAAFDGTDLEQRLEFGVVADRMMRVIRGAWWPGPTIDVRPARRDAGSSSTRCAIDSGESTTIRLADGQLTVATAAHELAHALAGVERGHDATFRAAYLDVITVITNLDPRDRRRDLHVAQLSHAFEVSGLAVAERCWPPPPASIAGPIAL